MLKFYKKHDQGWPAKNLPPKTHYYILWPSGFIQHACWMNMDTRSMHTPDGVYTAKVGNKPPWGTEIPQGQMHAEVMQQPPGVVKTKGFDETDRMGMASPDFPTADDLTGGIVDRTPTGPHYQPTGDDLTGGIDDRTPTGPHGRPKCFVCYMLKEQRRLKQIDAKYRSTKTPTGPHGPPTADDLTGGILGDQPYAP